MQYVKIQLSSFLQTGKTETCDKKIDLAIILDSSASIDEDNFNLAKDFAKRLLKRFTISPDNSRVSIVSYSQCTNILSRFSDEQDERKLEHILRNNVYEGSSTATGKTIQAVNFEVFSSKFGSRIGNPGKQFIEQKYKKNPTYIKEPPIKRQFNPLQWSAVSVSKVDDLNLLN